MNFGERIFDFLASLKLAVLIIIALGVISAVGTIYEARYDAEVAQKLVYKSWYMYAIMIALAVNLTAVMIDRWPWKLHHTGFLMAHVGIILILVGSWITYRFGIDGSMSFPIGEENRYVTVSETEFAIFAANGGTEGMIRLHHSPVDFFLNSPRQNPLRYSLGGESLEVIDYVHFGLRKSEIKPSDKEGDGPAIRVQLQNNNVNLTQWILMESGRRMAEMQLGPAKVVVTKDAFSYESGNALVLYPNGTAWRYEVYTQSRGGKTSSGTIREGQKVSTGWMNLELTVLRIYPRAREIVTYEDRGRPTPMTRAAVKIRFRGEEHWVGLNSVLKVFSDQQMYWINFANRRIDIGFPIKLTKFNVGRYPGTMRAASYESEVQAANLGTVTISMNQPLHHNDFTFYQASFEQDEKGNPTASVLSVNYDPGLWLKYLGSLMVVLGSIVLFYFKRAVIFKKAMGVTS